MSFEGFGSGRGKDKSPDCFCYTCDREIHHLGIMSHRAAHRRRNEDFAIEFSEGRIIQYQFSKDIS